MASKNIMADPEAFNVLKDWVKLHFGEDQAWLENSHTAFPHKVYHPQGNILPENTGPDVHAESWRFFLRDLDGSVAAYSVRQDKAGGTFHFNEIATGPGIAEQKNILESNSKKLENYEYSFLVLSKHKIRAFWFHGPEPDSDYFVPVSPCYYGLRAGKSYSRKEFTHIINAADLISSDSGIQLSGQEDLSGG